MLSVTPYLLFAAVASSAPAPSSSTATAPVKPAAAAPAEAFDRADAALAIGELATALEESFVFPDKGKAYAAMLRAHLAKGAYAAFDSQAAFAVKVTADLQAVHKDGHLRLRPAPARNGSGERRPGGGPPTASDVLRAGWVADGVAYIELGGMSGNDATLADLRKFLDAHGTATSGATPVPSQLWPVEGSKVRPTGMNAA